MADISASLHVRLIFLHNATCLVFFLFLSQFFIYFFFSFSLVIHFPAEFFIFPDLCLAYSRREHKTAIAQNCDDDKNSCLNFVSFLYKFTARFQAFIYRDVLNVYAQLKFNLVFFLPSQRI